MSLFAAIWRRVQAAGAAGKVPGVLPVPVETLDGLPLQPPPGRAPQAGGAETPLVPAASIAGRALVLVIAIMTFLAALTAGAAMLVADASRGWLDQVAQNITIQIRPVAGRDTGADTAQAEEIARHAAGIGDVHAISKDEAEALLQPWLGTGVDLSELPVPRLIAVELDPGQKLDIQALQKALSDKLPNASVDDHRFWQDRLGGMAQSAVAVAAVIFLLVLAAMGLAVGFATQGAMVGNREIIEVLHFAGAADHYISRQFQRHFFQIGLRGGALGGGAAMLVFFLSGTVLSWLRGTPDAAEMAILFGSFSLGASGYGVIALIAAGIAFFTGFVSRAIVMRHLRDLS